MDQHWENTWLRFHFNPCLKLPKRQQCLCSCAKQEKSRLCVSVYVCLCACAVENWDRGTSNQIVLTGTAHFLQRSVIRVATAVHTDTHMTIHGCAPTQRRLTAVQHHCGLQNTHQNKTEMVPKLSLSPGRLAQDHHLTRTTVTSQTFYNAQLNNYALAVVCFFQRLACLLTLPAPTWVATPASQVM